MEKVSAASADSEDLYQIALLIDQLKHDDVQFRINASKSIIQIARALGSERTRDELIPFLTESIDDEDDVILIIAEKLGELIGYVGGKDHMHHLLTPLECLISGEESAVRDKALRSIEIVVENMSNEHVSVYFVPMLIKLANRDWYTSRASAAALFHIAYKVVPDKTKLDLEAEFLRLCMDETPTVRRVASQHIVNMLKLVRSPEPLMEVLKAFARDDQDSIRIQVIPICIALCGHAKSEPSQLLPTIIIVTGDRSWRVRWCLAHRLHELLGAAMTGGFSDGPTFVKSLSSTFESLLNDTEAEVRAASASHLSKVAKFMQKADILASVIPTAQRLVTDTSEFVRAFFASEINHLAPLLGMDDTVQYLLPMLLLLFRDEASEVRLNVISNLTSINDVIGVELLSQSLLPAIAELAQDTKWRVRLAVIQHLPVLAKQLGKDFFTEKLSSLCTTWLADDVHSIRKAAAVNLKELSETFGDDWTRKQIIPTIEKLHTNKVKFSHRMTALYATQVLLQCLSADIVEHNVIPILLSLSDDPVPNVRLTVAKTLHYIIAPPPSQQRPMGDLTESASIVSSIISALTKLSDDPDRDVKFYADKALNDFERKQPD
jgi:serine/threonine-protein phosphatase 2A regulatory subunit A